MAEKTDAPVVASTTAKATSSTPGFILVVRNAFADYDIGQEITDAKTITEILSGELACYVIKRAL
ncbi:MULTISPECIES: hypothetical protein [Yersinia]|uniref:hypothetical protein n=1 Tax=Yersinia TaxID=629 RepID=UPI0011A28E8E|nr:MULTISPECIES: hypothetical protein [Yersinia]